MEHEMRCGYCEDVYGKDELFTEFEGTEACNDCYKTCVENKKKEEIEEENTDCPKTCKCKEPIISKRHLGDGGYDWCDECNGCVW